MEYRLRKNSKNIYLVSSSNYQSWFANKFPTEDKTVNIISQTSDIFIKGIYNINLYSINNIDFLASFLPIEPNVSGLDLLYIKEKLQNLFQGIYTKNDNLHDAINKCALPAKDKNKLDNYISIKEAYELAYNCYIELKSLDPHNIDRNVIIDKLHCIPDIQKFLFEYYLLTIILSDENDVIIVRDTSYIIYIKRCLLQHHDFKLVNY